MDDEKPTVPERLEGESAQDYHKRLQKFRQEHPAEAAEAESEGQPIFQDPALLFHEEKLKDIDPLLKRHQVIEPDGIDDRKRSQKPKGLRIVEECLASGEPYFVFRAKDIFSLMILGEYAHLIERYLPEAHEMSQGIADAQASFHTWQVLNPHRLRYPD